ncbi:UB2J1-like protein [Mya arenaria]|uniref:UB2J1-like protein n=1 Tax=Mya arenaria TaxID=6604 RepID=A0ABY7D877_MYAAR|nr:uncharacterized protein LOC128240227 [Mya arenaria]XP_052812839.1 uncharacterized protein LOC128240227 [Mya arenaria]WAQ93483.1 UB2J1-like protein [Mya arenaria]
MAVNLQRKAAMKRLAMDQHELEQQPVENVSAAPLDENMLEWHCNFRLDDIIYHLILYLPNKYPYESPSAEFVPVGFRYNSGATMPGKKGTKVCLNIFADFAYIHTEWKDQKGLGWSPGYTVQTILMNVVAFLAETQSGDSVWMKDTMTHNMKLSKGFKCEDCGHTYDKPYPPLPDQVKPKKPSAAKAAPKAKGPQIIDYMSKEVFKPEKPKSDGDLYGYGLIVSGPTHRPALTSPCEFLKFDSFNGMKKAVGTVHSVLKDELKYFLPLYIHPKHGEGIKDVFERVLTEEIAALLPKCKAKKTPIEEMVIKTIPNLMSATVVEFSKGTQHTSDNSLNGYFALHRLFLWALETYPDLQGIIEQRLKDFIADENNRTKKACPHIGEWLMLLSGSWKHNWLDAAEAYLSESMKRQVMWFVKDDSKLGMLDTPKEYRLAQTLTRTAVSRKLLAFQVLFLDIAMPAGKSRKELIKRYDDNLGFPTADMVAQMKDSVERINNMKTFDDWYKVLKLKPPSEQEMFDKLVKNVEYSIWTDGYNWSFWKTGGGWGEVLRRYKPYKPKTDKPADGGAEPKGKGKAPVKGSAPVKGKGKKATPKEEPEVELVKAKPARAAPAGKGRGKKAKVAESESESDDESDMDVEVLPVPRGKGRGRGRGRGGEAVKEEKPVGGGRRRGAAKGKAAKQVVEEEVKPKGRGKRSVEAALGKQPAGRGGKKKKA